MLSFIHAIEAVPHIDAILLLACGAIAACLVAVAIVNDSGWAK
jgi:hypothetical protein